MPYITSSIIMQLLQAVIPKFEAWSKEGETGQRKITQITRYLTLGLGFVESIGLIATFENTLATSGVLPSGAFDWLTRVLILFTLMAGTAFIMWMGELITQRGIGNGMSLLIFANIVARFPGTLVEAFQLGQWYWAVAIIVAAFGVVVAIVAMERAQRRIPVQYAKRVVGRKVFGGVGTYIPLKLNAANVVPIIFALLGAELPGGARRVLEHPVAQGRGQRDGQGPGQLAADGPAHPLLRVLLHGADLQPDRSGRQPAQAGRLHPGRPSGQGDVELHRERAEPDHAAGRAVPRGDRDRARRSCSSRRRSRCCSSSAVRRS